MMSGRGISNPPFPRRVTSLLFICQGNICRSPFAAALAGKLLMDAGHTGLSCRSAGLRTNQGAAPPPEACEAAAAFRVSLAGHVPVQLDRTLLDDNTVLVVMEARHMQAVRAAYPDVSDKVILLPLFGGSSRTGYAAYNIADPFGQTRATFDACYTRIEKHLRLLLRSENLLGIR